MLGERRKHPRLAVRNARIRNVLIAGEVLNLSLGGLAMESGVAARVGSRQQFRLVLADRSLPIEGVVCWCRLRRTEKRGRGEVAAVFRMGLSFTRAPELFLRPRLRRSGDWIEPDLNLSR